MTEEYEKKSFLEDEIAENKEQIKLTGERLLTIKSIMEGLNQSMVLLREQETILQQQYKQQIEEASGGEK